jgi:hypothetical protein
MGRPKSKPQPAAEGTASPSEGTINKAAAIRRALAEGLTKYEDAAPFIKTHLGHDITPGHFASAKSREKPSGGPAPKRGRPPGKTMAVTVKAKRGRKPKAAVASPAASSPKPRADSGDLLAEMEALKPLVESMGKDKAHRIIDLLG